MKTQFLGPARKHQQEVNFLNRIVQWNGATGFVIEADPRHAELIIEQLQFKDSKGVTIPGAKDEGHTQDNAEEKLNEEQATKYRAIVVRCNHLAPDRPDISFAVKELAR